jgi:hypothetical protein
LGRQGIYWFYGAIYVGYTCMSLTLLIVGAVEKDGTAPFLTGLFTSALWLPFLLLLVGHFARPLVIKGWALRVPSGLRIREVPLASVAGVGLVYRAATQFAGWRLQVWYGHG